jgi:hypothetical protein
MAEQSIIIFHCVECNAIASGTTNRPRTCNTCHHFATAHKSDARTHACPLNADGEVIVCPGWTQCPTSHTYVLFPLVINQIMQNMLLRSSVQRVRQKRVITLFLTLWLLNLRS